MKNYDVVLLLGVPCEADDRFHISYSSVPHCHAVGLLDMYCSQCGEQVRYEVRKERKLEEMSFLRAVEPEGKTHWLVGRVLLRMSPKKAWRGHWGQLYSVNTRIAVATELRKHGLLEGHTVALYVLREPSAE